MTVIQATPEILVITRLQTRILTTAFLFTISTFPATLVAQPSPITDLSEGPDFSTQLVHMLLSLGLVIALMLVGAWILKRLLNQRIVQMNSNSLIKLIERRSLSPKAAIYLIEVKGKTVLVGEGTDGLRALAELPANSVNDSSIPTQFETIYRGQSQTQP